MFFKSLLLLLGLLLFTVISANSTSLWVPSLNVAGKVDVVDESNPSLGWEIIDFSKNYSWQSAYQIIVASTKKLVNSEKPDLWDTGKVYSTINWNIRYQGKDLAPGQRVFAGVRVWDQNDSPTKYGYGTWRREFSAEQWTAKWISPPKSLQQASLENMQLEEKEVINTHPGIKPVYYYRKTFTITDPVASVFLHCSAKGLFKGYLTDQYGLNDGSIWPLILPGWTNYNKTIQYHSFDVTGTFKRWADNTLAFIVAPGWYSGYIGPENYDVYGNVPSLLIELQVTYPNGTKTIIVSDESWKVNVGPLVYSDLLHGEITYENRHLDYWLGYDFNDTDWYQPDTESLSTNVKLVSDTSAPDVGSTKLLVRVDDYWKIDEDVFVYKMSSILTGRVSIRIRQRNNIRVKIRYAEAVYPNGSIYTGNHKSALDTDIIVLNDPANRPDYVDFDPIFTYRSFLYVEITGLKTPLDPQNEIVGHSYGQDIAITTKDHETSEHSLTLLANADSSHTILMEEKLIASKGVSKLSPGDSFLQTLNAAIGLSHSGNTLSIITNTVSKDTKLGWLEPVGLYSLSGLYMSGVPQIFRKVLRDAREAQAPSGAFSNVVPKAVDESDASPGSGFAPIIITYNIYKLYADLDVVKENYDSNKKWMKYVRGSNPNYLFTRNTGNNLGDFANVNAETPKDVIATAYYAYGSLLMSYLAKALNQTADAAFYSQLHKNVSNAFVKAYVNESDGNIEGDTQTGYVVALAFSILPDEQIPKAVTHLLENIKAHDYHLTTGYVGTAFILQVLCDHGYIDIAYKLLYQETYPSWKYMFDNGPTSIWERWDSWTKNDNNDTSRIHENASLNSLGLASVGGFLYQYICGIDTDPEEVGFKKIIIKPHVGGNLPEIMGTFQSNYGPIKTEWVQSDTEVYFELDIPINTKAKMILPFKKEKWEKDFAPGQYSFTVPLD